MRGVSVCKIARRLRDVKTQITNRWANGAAVIQSDA